MSFSASLTPMIERQTSWRSDDTVLSCPARLGRTRRRQINKQDELVKELLEGKRILPFTREATFLESKRATSLLPSKVRLRPNKASNFFEVRARDPLVV